MKKNTNYTEKLKTTFKDRFINFGNLLLATNVENPKNKLMQYVAYLLIVITVNFIVGKNLANIDYSWYSNVSIFLLVNINIILMLGLMLVIFRQVAKIIAESNSKVFGANLKLKLIAFTVMITVIPIVIFYFFAVTIVNSSINKWFDVQVDSALESSVSLMEDYHRLVQDSLINQSSLMASYISNNLKDINNKAELSLLFEEYIKRDIIDGIAIYNNENNLVVATNEVSEELSNTISNQYIQSVSQGNQEQGYQFNNNEQMYWAGLPIINPNSKLLGTLFVYKTVSESVVKDLDLIQSSKVKYRESTYFSYPIKNAYYLMLLLMALLVIFASIWGSVQFSGTITRPIEELAEASVEISKGNMHVSVEEQGSDEIKYLIQTFNSMTKQIDTHTRELHNKNEILSEVYSQVSHDKMYIDAMFKHVNSAVVLLSSNLEIIKANDKADSFISDNHLRDEKAISDVFYNFTSMNSDEYTENIELETNGEVRIYSTSISKLTQDDEEHVLLVLSDITDVLNSQRVSMWREIATNIAHEFKNPLTPIKLLAQRVKKRSAALQEPKIKEIISESMDTIVTEADGLLELVEDFNMFARLPQAKRVSIGLSEIMQDIKYLYTESYPNVNINIDIADDIMINADRSQIRRVTQNLISNAVSAVNQQGEINVSAHYTDEDNVIITIADNGVGIKGEDLPKIFTPYYTKRMGGTGLGLAIVKKIIDEHDGKISVESKIDVGTMFTLTIPKGR